jgi:hypothetical protein
MKADTVDQLLSELQGDAEKEQLALELQGKLCNALTERLDEEPDVLQLYSRYIAKRMLSLFGNLKKTHHYQQQSWRTLSVWRYERRKQLLSRLKCARISRILPVMNM